MKTRWGFAAAMGMIMAAITGAINRAIVLSSITGPLSHRDAVLMVMAYALMCLPTAVGLATLFTKLKRRSGTGFLNDPVFQDLGTGKTMFHIDPNLYLVLNRHSLMLVYLKIS